MTSFNQITNNNFGKHRSYRVSGLSFGSIFIAIFECEILVMLNLILTRKKIFVRSIDANIQ